MSLRNLTVICALSSFVLVFIGRPAAQVFTTPKGEAQNVRFEPGAAGVVTVTYDLVATDSRGVFSVSLEASLDLGKTFPLRAGAVSGDVGTGVRPGPGKRIIWESAKDTERLDLAQLRFRIAAAGAPLPVVETAPPPAEPAPSAPAKKGGNGKVIGIIGGVGAAGAIAAVAAGGGGGGGGTTPIAGTGTTTTTTTVPAATPNRSPTFQGIAASPSDKVGIESATVFIFSAAGASDPDGDALTYDWDFGDGSAHGTSPTPSKTYARSGVFEVRLTISDGKGGTAFAASEGLRITNMNGIWDLVITALPRTLPLATRVTMTMSQSGTSLTGVWSWIDECFQTRTQEAHGNITSPRDILFGVEHWLGNEGGCSTTTGVDTYLLGPLSVNLNSFSGTCSNCGSTFSATRR